MDLAHCFKACDVRGRVPDELDPESVYRIGRAYADWLQPRRVAVGRDIRHTSDELAEALMRGVGDAGVDVVDIGQGGTEYVYFATASLALDGGIMVTASHHPPEYNGLRFVGKQSRPISDDSGLQDIRRGAEAGQFVAAAAPGNRVELDIKPFWRDHVLRFVDVDRLRPLSIVCNAGNGGAGSALDLLEARLPFRFTKVHHHPDGGFPNGVPDPMIEANRAATARSVRLARADFGIAFDGDFDRCFFFDEQGGFIDGYYIVGVLATVFLERQRGARILHDPRQIWNTQNIVRANGGVPVQGRSGHAFMKHCMREVNAIYGGEVSGRHYFRDFFYCDSGMIPWLVLAELLSRSGKPLSWLVDGRMRQFPASGEISRRIGDTRGAIEAVRQRYMPGSVKVESIDGLSVEHPRWRFNLRSSNTEPLMRLNVESRGDVALMRERTAGILELLERHA